MKYTLYSNRKCFNCGNRYNVWITPDLYPGSREREDIKCPCCDSIEGYIKTSGTVLTEKADSVGPYYRVRVTPIKQSCKSC